MKTTKRIIRLPNNVQNVCDIPKPVAGINDGIYSEENLSTTSTKEEGAKLSEETARNLQSFSKFQDLDQAGREEDLLHVCIELFFKHLKPSKVIKKCIIGDNHLAAAKIALLSGNILQAFDFSLQLGMKNRGNHSEKIFEAFLFYLKRADAGDDEDGDGDQRRKLLERLIGCWQDQKFSFLQLEKLCLAHADPLLLQTLVLTLFRPENEDQSQDFSPQGPALDQGSGPKLVDLFTPEFCLRIGDKFVKEMRQEHDSSDSTRIIPKLERQASEVADDWIRRNQNLTTKNADEED